MTWRVARSTPAQPVTDDPAATDPALAWMTLADALLARAVAARPHATVAPGAPEPAPRDISALEAAVADARRRFAASLDEPTALGALAHNARFSVEDAEVLAVAAAVEADPRLQRLVAFLHDDASRTRVTLHTLASLFPSEHSGVRAVGPDAALRRAALVDVLEDGPWAAYAHDAVTLAISGTEPPQAREARMHSRGEPEQQLGGGQIGGRGMGWSCS